MICDINGQVCIEQYDLIDDSFILYVEVEDIGYSIPIVIRDIFFGDDDEL